MRGRLHKRRSLWHRSRVAYNPVLQNHCFFESLAFLLIEQGKLVEQPTDHVMDIRNEIADYTYCHPGLLRKAVAAEGVQPSMYLAMLRQSLWGGMPEAIAAASVWNCRVRVVSPSSTVIYEVGPNASSIIFMGFAMKHYIAVRCSWREWLMQRQCAIRARAGLTAEFLSRRNAIPKIAISFPGHQKKPRTRITAQHRGRAEAAENSD